MLADKMLPSSDPEVESIINEITAAFHNTQRGKLSFHQAKIAKYASSDQIAQAALLDLDHHWNQIIDADLEAGGKALYVDDAESWRYFIPAFMICTRSSRRNSSI